MGLLRAKVEYLCLTAPRGLASRFRLFSYRALGLAAGQGNRIEGGGRFRRCSNIELGSYNAISEGAWLWPIQEEFRGIRIRIGNYNYFNRNLMIDACGYIEIGDENMIGPDVYITDSNHQFGTELGPKQMPMSVGQVIIGNRCWIGAKAVILKDVTLGDGCVVAAGSVVTKPVAAGVVVAGVPARRMK